MEERVLNAELPSKRWLLARDASPVVKSIHAMLRRRHIVLVGATENYSLPNMCRGGCTHGGAPACEQGRLTYCNKLMYRSKPSRKSPVREQCSQGGAAIEFKTVRCSECQTYAGVFTPQNSH